MSMDLLPPSATAQERQISDANCARCQAVPVPLRALWDPYECPMHLLPWLAWALSVDEWDPQWSEQAKRDVIAASLEVHRRKGTVWSIRVAIGAAGYGDSQLIEGDSNTLHNGTYTHNGLRTYGDQSGWARYRFILTRPISNAQADQVRRMLARIAPARCHLIELVFTQASNLYNGAILHDGAYNHGIA